MIESPKVGDRVSYEDAANPKKVGTIVQTSGDRQFRVEWDGEPDAHFPDDTWADLRQAGWKRVDPPALGTAIRRVERLMETVSFSTVTKEALGVVLDAARKGAN